MINLQGMHILVTRPKPQGVQLCAEIEKLHGHAFYFPTIAFTCAPDQQALLSAVAQLAEQDWIIFISPQAVKASLNFVQNQALPSTVKLAAVGEGTANALLQAGFNIDVIPSEWTSEGLLALPQFQSVANKKIAVVRGVGGREKIDSALAERGAHVLPVIAYQRVIPEVDISDCVNCVKRSSFDCIVCTSFESVNNLKNMLGPESWPYLRLTPLLVVSERIKTLAQDLGFQTIWVSVNASQQAILDTLAKMRK